MSGKDLQGINFHGANLENADLSDIITSRAIQKWVPPGSQCSSFTGELPDEGARMLADAHKCAEIVFQNEATRTYFNNANLREVTMHFSDYSSMHYVDFSGADLTGIEISNVAFRDSKFIGTELNDSKIDLATFFYVDFSNAELENAQFTGTPFFQNVIFHNAQIIDGYFDKPIFIDVDFSNADLKSTTFNGVQVAGNVVFKCKNHEICN